MNKSWLYFSMFFLLVSVSFALSSACVAPTFLTTSYFANLTGSGVANEVTYWTNATNVGSTGYAYTAVALAANCPAGQVVQNTTNTGVQCVTPAAGNASGTVTAVTAGFGLNTTTITTTGTLHVNSSTVQLRVNETCAAGSSIRVINENGSVVCEADSGGSGTVTQIDSDQSLIGTPITTTGTLSVNLSYLVGNFGNWSADKPNYATLLYVNAINNLSLTQIASNIGNFSQFFPAIYGNFTSIGNFSQFFPTIYANITGLNSSLTANKSGTGTVTCGTGTVLQNVTLSSGAPSGQCVVAGIGNGTVTGSGSTTNISYWDSSSSLATTNIFYNTTAQNIGINTTTPSHTLSVVGNANITNVSYLTNITIGGISIWNNGTALCIGVC